MSWRVLVTAGPIQIVGQAAATLLRDAGCTLATLPTTAVVPSDELPKLLEGADAVLAGPELYPDSLLSSPAAARLKILSRWGVGFDAIDIPAATRLGIVVANTPGLLNEAVADYTFSLLLALARRIHESHLSMLRGEWAQSWGTDVTGKTLGIVGCGGIGQAVARRARGFEMTLLGYDVTPNENARALGIQFVPLPELLARSDFVTLHAALTPENRGLIGEPQLRRMKSTALLVNAARGGLADEPALLRALREGWIAGAALDVFAQEPLPGDHPLRTLPNVLLTPHQASYGRETGERVSLAAAQAILSLMHGRRPQSVVNPDVFHSPALRAPVNSLK